MPKAKKGKTCQGKRGLRGEKKRERVGREESFENPSESSWFQAGPHQHGNRLQAGLAATGNRQLDGVELVLATCDSSDVLNNPWHLHN